MINKDLTNFSKDKEKFLNEINKCTDEEMKKQIKVKFKDELKLYLFNANKAIKETFGFDSSPFYKQNGLNAFYQKDPNAIEIKKKSKADYYKDLDILKNSATYNSLDKTKKALIDNAIYILENYYEDSLQ